MAGFIIIDQNKIWGPARWVFNKLTDDISKNLNSKKHKELKTIISKTKENYTHLIDIEKLSIENKIIFNQAIKDAAIRLEFDSGENWHKSDFFDSYKNCVLELVKLMKDVEEKVEIDFANRPKYIFTGKKNDI